MTAPISLHREPIGIRAIARHYIRELIYGANDGLITTFAVVAGVAGGALSARATMIIGTANLFADGLSMAAGNYLSIRSYESARAAEHLPQEEASPLRHAVATFLAFVAAGAIPLMPFAFDVTGPSHLTASTVLTFATLFAIGALRTLITVDRWWMAGLEMLVLGVAVSIAAYGSGYVVAWVLAHA
jgi:VIT1/CCC1 family predicted Fe2+/Mn2+ transporter